MEKLRTTEYSGVCVSGHGVRRCKLSRRCKWATAPGQPLSLLCLCSAHITPPKSASWGPPSLALIAKRNQSTRTRILVQQPHLPTVVFHSYSTVVLAIYPSSYTRYVHDAEDDVWEQRHTYGHANSRCKQSEEPLGMVRYQQYVASKDIYRFQYTPLSLSVETKFSVQYSSCGPLR